MNESAMATRLYFDPIFLEHDTGAHPETAERLRVVREALDRRGLWQPEAAAEAGEPAPSVISRVHAASYVSAIERFAASGGGQLDADTVVSRASYHAAARAVGVARSAVDAVLGGEASNALCLVRPPGHHARPLGGMGFCLFNNIALAARHAIEEVGMERVAIVDWDVHHGNGTQDAFWEDPSVLFVSLHRWPFYPGTGHQDDCGEGAGRGSTHNVPLPGSTRREVYRSAFDRALEEIVAPFRPELILVSAGFDTFAGDPIGGLGLEPEDFGALTRSLRQVAEDTCQGRVVSLLEGGYSLEHLGDCVAAHLEALRAGVSPQG